MSAVYSKVRELISHSEIQRLGFFVFAGAAGLLINLSLTYFLTEYVRVWYLWSFCIGTIVSWTCSFFLNAFLTFNYRPNALRDWCTRYLLYVMGYLGFFWINIGIVYAGTSIMGLPYLVSISLSAVATTAGTYLMSRSVVFSPREQTRRPLRSYAPSCLLAIFIGAICVAPQVYFAYTSPSYAGITMMGTDAEEHYAARIQQVYAGHLTLGNAFLASKDQPYAVPSLGEIIVAWLGRILGMHANEVVVFSKFLFPFLVALVLYFFVEAMFDSPRIALLGTAFAMLGDNLLSGIGPWRALLHGTSSATGFITFARPVNPEVSALLLFGALYVLYRGFWERITPHIGHVFALALLMGATAYISPYVFTFLGVVTFIALLCFVYKRENARARGLFGSGALALICAIPFLYNYRELTSSLWYADLALRQGLISTHAPVFSFWLFFLAGAVFIPWPQRYQPARYFFAICIGSLWVLTEQQILTGVSLQPSHYHWYITKPLVGVLLGMYGSLLIDFAFRRMYVRAIAVAVLLFLVGYNAVLVQESSYRALYPGTVAAQKYASVIAYLNTKLPQTVWASSDLSTYISIYTFHNAPNNTYTIYYLNPSSFYEDRLFLNYRLRGFTPNGAQEIFNNERVSISQALFGMYYREMTGSYGAIPDSTLASLVGKYQRFYARRYEDIRDELGITLFVIDTEKSKKNSFGSTFAQPSFVEPAGFTVYVAPS
jgi:putative flippase GtrA